MRITAQDAHIAGYVHDAAKGIVIVVNKWDLVRERRRAAEALADPDRPVSLVPGETPASDADDDLLDAKQYMRALRENLKFLPYAPVVFAAAKTRYHIGPILDHALRIFDIRQMRIPTAQLNDIVRDAVQRHHPAVVQGRAAKIYYATQADINPPTFVFFVNDPTLLHFSYQRYLENKIREAFSFEGTAAPTPSPSPTGRGEPEQRQGKVAGAEPERRGTMHRAVPRVTVARDKPFSDDILSRTGERYDGAGEGATAPYDGTIRR